MTNIKVFTGIVCVGLGLSFTNHVMAQSSGDGTTLEEIVVTAQKRTEDMQKAAVSVVAVQRQDNERRGVTSLDDALKSVAGLKISSVPTGSGGGMIYIRGIGTQFQDDRLASQQAVALNVDGVDTSSSKRAVTGSMFDVERIEVLRGPQGTLYGASAEGGVINVVMAQPNTDKFEARARVQAGNFETKQYEAVINVPVTDNLAFRLTGAHNERVGYVKGPASYTAAYSATDPTVTTVYNSKWGAVDSDDYRIKAKYTPTDSTTINVTLERVNNDNTGEAITTYQRFLSGLSFERDCSVAQGPPGSVAYASTCVASQLKDRNDSWSVSIEQELGKFGVLTFIPTYSKNTRLVEVDPNQTSGSGTPRDRAQNNYELRLNSSADSDAKWVVGGYMSKAKYNLYNVAANLLPSPTNDTYAVNEVTRPFDSWSVFGQYTYPVSESFRLTAGGRYSHTESSVSYYLYKSADADQCDAPPGAPPGSACTTRVPVATATPVYTAAEPQHNLTYKAGFEKDLAEQSMLYGQVSTGYKPGGINLNDGGGAAVDRAAYETQLQHYKAEYQTTFEVGSKNRFFGDTLQLNGDVYYGNWKDQQISANVCRVAGCDLAVQGNAINVIYNNKSSKQLGAEVELTWLVTSADRVTVNAAFMHTKYGALFVYVPVGSDENGVNQGSRFVQYDGHRMANSPDASATISYEHAFKFKNGWTLRPHIDEFITSDYYNTPEYYFYGAHVGSYTKTDASLSLEGKNWNVNGYVRNIEDKAVAQFAFPPGVFPAEPRAFGVTVTASF